MSANPTSAEAATLNDAEAGLPKVLLIGGVSHLGKSTLAQRLADALGWRYLSTDQLARHPGRPWRGDAQPLPADVVAHYAQLTTAQLVESVLAHYQHNVWPIAQAIVRSHLSNPYDPPLVFEGSALMPVLVAAAAFQRVSFVCLHGSDALIEQRILQSSGFVRADRQQQQLIQAFLQRSLVLNELTLAAARTTGCVLLDAQDPEVYQRLRASIDQPSG